jgi:oxygen-independent coproporphyrinogen-3 oxidase
VKNGADRISVNPQTMIPEVLEAIGRRHSPEEMTRAFKETRAAGFTRINTDLIAGLPADSPAGFRESLESVLALGPENITVHTLSIKRGSTLNELGGALPGGREVSEMLDFASNALTDAGYRPYYLYRQKNSAGGFENTGWTKAVAESFYNICMMEELCGALALGGGAVTKMVDSATGFIARSFNPKYPYEYNTGRDKIQKAKDEFFGFYAARRTGAP